MKVPTSHPDHQHWMFQCVADDNHWIKVEWWDNDDDYPILEVVLVLWPQTWRSRIVSAISSLRGRQVPINYVLLDQDRARELHAVIGSMTGFEQDPLVDGFRSAARNCAEIADKLSAAGGQPVPPPAAGPAGIDPSSEATAAGSELGR